MPKGVTEAIHQEAFDGYMIETHVTVNPLISIAVVTVLISKYLESVDCPSLPQLPLCWLTLCSPLGVLPLSLDSLLLAVPLLDSLIATHGAVLRV